MSKKDQSNSNSFYHLNQSPESASHRIHINPENIKKERILLLGEPLKKVRLVLRLKPKDQLIVFDGSGCEYLAQITFLTPHEGELFILKKANPMRESPLEIHLGQAVPKSGKMDFIVQKAVELGVFEIHPFYSGRTIPRYDRLQEIKRVKRWQKISHEASQQSGRLKIPSVNAPIDFPGLLQHAPKGSLKIILQKDFSGDSLKTLFKNNQNQSQIFFLVGPEGGFTSEEINLSLNHGFTPLCLGERTLRTETVALAFLSIIQYELGDINKNFESSSEVF